MNRRTGVLTAIGWAATVALWSAVPAAGAEPAVHAAPAVSVVSAVGAAQAGSRGQGEFALTLTPAQVTPGSRVGVTADSNPAGFSMCEVQLDGDPVQDSCGEAEDGSLDASLVVPGETPAGDHEVEVCVPDCSTDHSDETTGTATLTVIAESSTTKPSPTRKPVSPTKRPDPTAKPTNRPTAGGPPTASSKPSLSPTLSTPTATPSSTPTPTSTPTSSSTPIAVVPPSSQAGPPIPSKPKKPVAHVNWIPIAAISFGTAAALAALAFLLPAVWNGLISRNGLIGRNALISRDSLIGRNGLTGLIGWSRRFGSGRLTFRIGLFRRRRRYGVLWVRHHLAALLIPDPPAGEALQPPRSRAPDLRMRLSWDRGTVLGTVLETP